MVVNKKSKQKEIPIKDIQREVDERLAGADLVRLRGMEGLTRLRRAKSTSVAREKKRLTKKLGPKDPRVLNLERKEKVNQQMIQDLDLETDRVKTDVSGFDKEAWNLYGYVRDRNYNPVPNLTVALYDEKEQWIKQMEYACTDKRGFFSIIYSQKEKAQKQKEIPESMKLFIHVSDRNKNVLYKDQQPLYLKIGQVDYREIYLPEETSICTPPGPPEPEQEPGKPGPGQQQTEPEQEQKQTEPIQDKEQWIVEGVVKDENNKPSKDVKVRLYDEKHIHDNRLGERVTNEEGKFKFTFKGEDFQALMKAKVDIYLEVVDDKGKTVYTSPQALQCQPGGVDTFDIQVQTKTKKQRR